MTPEKFIHLLTHAKGLAPEFLDKARACAASLKEGKSRTALETAIAKADVVRPGPEKKKAASSDD